MYNQGILFKIFKSLDDGQKGYLNWKEFLEGMKIVFSTSAHDKVDLFLKMVDEEENGSYSIDEIKEICLLTFEDEAN